jgi:RHS repeat-associated protein
VLAEVDNQGRINSDSQGVEHPLRRYEVYGNEIGTTPSTSNQKFCGSIGHTTEDNTGLIYMRARWYDPTLGRFISEDPARDGNNWYVYCGNNPVNKVDSTGKFVEEELIGAAGEASLEAGGGGCALAAKEALLNTLYRALANRITAQIAAIVGEENVVAQVYMKTGQYAWYIYGSYLARLDLSGHSGTPPHFNVQWLEGEGHYIAQEAYDFFLEIIELLAK